MVSRDDNLVRAILAVHLGLVSLEEAQRCLGSDPQAPVLESLVSSGCLDPNEARQAEELADALVRANRGYPDEALELFGGWEAVGRMFAQDFGRRPAAGSGIRADDGGQVSTEQVGRYRTHAEQDASELGRGAIGRVFVAYDDHTGREVAIKELLPDRLGDGGHPDTETGAVVSRFLREARVTAQLEHPNIVPVYEVGRRRDGTLYYCMRVVRGRTLLRAICDAMSMEERLRLLVHFVDLCQAVAYAHSRGVVHRDIKPQNVMVGQFGETILLDWGVAKVRGQHDIGQGILAQRIRNTRNEAPLTVEGDLLGTPAYMSPEQASGDVDEVDERSDVYGLGVVLRVLLLGPDASRASGTLPVVTEQELGSIAVLRGSPNEDAREDDGDISSVVDRLRRRFLAIPLPADAPSELAAICVKATSDSKDHRYASAAELAEEVQAFLDGRRVGAYAYGSIDLVRRFVDKHRVTVAATVLACFAVLAVAVVSYVRVVGERNLARKAEAAARLRVAEAQSEGARAAMQAGDPLEARAKLRGSLEAADTLAARVLRWRASLNPATWTRTLDGHPYQLAFDPSGAWVAVGFATSVVLFDTTTSQPLRVLRGQRDHVTSVAVNGQGTQVAAGAWGGAVWIWEYPDGAGRQLEGQPPEAIHSLSFHPTEPVLAVGSREISLWDTSKNKRLRTLEGKIRGAYSVAFDPKGDVLASATADHAIRLWNWRTGEEKKRLEGKEGGARSVAFSPDGKLLAAGGYDGVLRLWSTGSWKLEKQIPVHEVAIYGLSFRPDSKWIATGDLSSHVAVYDVTTEERVRGFAGHTGAVRNVAFAPDGEHLASVGMNDTVRMWNVGIQPEPHRTGGHDGAINRVAVSPDGRTIATVGGAENSVRLWDAETGKPIRAMMGHDSGILAVAYSPDGEILASGDSGGTICLWDAASGKERARLVGHKSTVYSLVFGPDGKVLLSGGSDRTIRVWDVESARLLRTLDYMKAAVVGMALGSDGRMLVTAGSDGVVRLWKTYERLQHRSLRGHSGLVRGVRFTPDEQYIVSSGEDGEIWSWSVATGEGRKIGEQPGRAYWLGMHPSGDLVVVPGSDRVVRFWSLSTGKVVELHGHSAEVQEAAFTPDGKYAVSVAEDATVRMWDVATGHPRFRAPILLGRERPELCTSRGWERIGDGVAVASDQKWRDAVAKDAIVADACTEACAADSKPFLCAGTMDGELQRWNMDSDRRLAVARVGRIQQVVTLRDGCAALVGDSVVYLNDAGEVSRIEERDARGIGRHQSRLWVIAGNELLDFDDRLQPSAPIEVGRGVTAVARDGEKRVIGYEDGTVVFKRSPGAEDTLLETTPSRAVTLVRFGPARTLVVGFADGSVGLWNERTSRRLQYDRLHGPVVHMQLAGSTLYVATALADHLAWNLSALQRPYCDLLRETWEAIPVEWRDGKAVVAEPPRDHACAAASSAPTKPSP